MSTQVQDTAIDVNAIAQRLTSETAKMTVSVGVALTEGTRMDVELGKHRITVDEPVESGGTGAGPSPIELMLAALTTCQAITYRLWSMKLGIPFDAVHVEADGDLDLRGFYGVDDAVRPGYQAIRLRVKISGPAAPERYRELAEKVDRHCPVLDITGSTVPVERTLVTA